MTEHVTIWKAFLDGVCKQIGLSEVLLRNALRRNPWYEEENKSRWTIRAETLEIPVVDGRVIMADRWHIQFDGSPISTDRPPDAKAPHVSWLCPFCGNSHVTDIEPADGQQGLWFCQRSTKGIALVRWEGGGAPQPTTGLSQ